MLILWGVATSPNHSVDPLDSALAAAARDCDNPDMQVRTRAFVQLAALGERAVPVLVERLRKPDESTDLAISALIDMGTIGGLARDALIECYHEQPVFRQALVLEALAAVAPEDHAAGVVVTQAVMSRAPSVRRSALRALRKFPEQCRSTNGVQMILTALRDPDWNVRVEALTIARVFSMASGEIVHALIRATSDSDESVRAEAFLGLAAVRVGEVPLTADLVLTGLQDESANVRLAAVRLAARVVGTTELRTAIDRVKHDRDARVAAAAEHLLRSATW